jgi:hypothetical protein
MFHVLLQAEFKVRRFQVVKAEIECERLKNKFSTTFYLDLLMILQGYYLIACCKKKKKKKMKFKTINEPIRNFKNPVQSIPRTVQPL